MRTRGALVFMAALVCARPAVAQTSFAWPDTAVDVSKYTTLEECRAAVLRVRNTVHARDFHATHVWRDTTTLQPGEHDEPIDAAVGQTTRQCITPFADPATASLEDFRFLVPLYLLAGWNDRANSLAERKLASVNDTTAEFAAVVDTLLEIYRGRGTSDVMAGRHPDLVDSLVRKHVPRIHDRVARILTYWKAAGAYSRDEGEDAPQMAPLLERIIALTDSLNERERRRLGEKARMLGTGEEQADRLAGVFELGRNKFLDSLRSSTEEYVRAKRNLWTRATGQPPETYLLGSPIGEKAPQIQADFWLGCEGDCGVRPVPGRVNLIVFLSRADCTGIPVDPANLSDRCARVLIPLRRMIQRYPAVAVTIVARTHGYYVYLKDNITAEKEAQLTRAWLDWFGVDAPLAVSETPFWRISRYDQRRIERPVPNQENYSFGRTTAAGGLAAYLIDQDGLIVHGRQANRHSEVEFSGLIDVLLERGKSAP